MNSKKRDKAYFALKMRESRKRNKPYFYIEMDGKKYLFRKKDMNKIKPNQIDDTCIIIDQKAPLSKTIVQNN